VSIHLVRPDDHTELHVESIGGIGGDPLVLLGGATWSKDWWDDRLCALFADAGFRVVRFDQRDTGESTFWPPGGPGYTGADLVSDVVAVMDGLELGGAHVVGLSMGGGLAQQLAFRYSSRVLSSTLMSTSPAGPVRSELPGPTPAIARLFTEAADEPDWADRAAVVEHLVEGERPFAGPGSFDEDVVRATAGRVVDRTRSLPSAMTNHFLLSDGGAAPVELSELGSRPTLVVHGTADPLFPVEHGRALAEHIPGAELLELADVGHQLPPPRHWDALVGAVARQRELR